MRHQTPEIRTMLQHSQSTQNIERLLWIIILLLTAPTFFMAGRLHERQINSKTAQQSTPAW